MEIKYPEVIVSANIDGNAFMILGTVTRALSKAGYGKEVIDAYVNEATDGDYDHLLRVTMQTVTFGDPSDF